MRACTETQINFWRYGWNCCQKETTITFLIYLNPPHLECCSFIFCRKPCCTLIYIPMAMKACSLPNVFYSMWPDAKSWVLNMFVSTHLFGWDLEPRATIISIWTTGQCPQNAEPPAYCCKDGRNNLRHQHFFLRSGKRSNILLVLISSDLQTTNQPNAYSTESVSLKSSNVQNQPVHFCKSSIIPMKPTVN